MTTQPNPRDLWGVTRRTHLSERGRVDAVLGSELKADSGALLGVPGSLSASLDGGVDLLVKGGGEDVEGVGGGDGSVVGAGGVADGGGVLGDGGLLDVVANLTTNEETLVGEDSVGDGADGAGGVQVGEDAAVEVGLLEVEVDLLALVADGGVEVGENLGLQALGEGVVKLDLGGQEVGRVPGLGDADAWIVDQSYVQVGVLISAPVTTARWWIHGAEG